MTNISQGSVATCIKCGGIFNDHFNTNLLTCLADKEISLYVALLWTAAHFTLTANNDPTRSIINYSLKSLLPTWV